MNEGKSRRFSPAAIVGWGSILFIISTLDWNHAQPDGASQHKFSSSDAGIFATTSVRWMDPRSTTSAGHEHPAPRPAAQLPAREPAPREQTPASTASPLPGPAAAENLPRYDFQPGTPKASWRSLTRNVRSGIDSATLHKGRWRTIVLHSSATDAGSARAFDYYHRHVKNMNHGLAYHFLIGNGNGSGDGEIEVGDRWLQQLPGGHLRSDLQNQIAIGICLVGDFESNRVTPRQLEALDELIDYLHAKLGKIEVTSHHVIDPQSSHCPGRNFPPTSSPSAETP